MQEFTKYTQTRAAVSQAWNDITRPIEIQNAPHAKKVPYDSGAIEFDDVSFDYGRNLVINHFNLTINKNEK